MWIRLIFMTAVVTLSGCKSTQLSEQQCNAISWQEQGMLDGSTGAKAKLVEQYHQDCQHSANPFDKTAYQNGFSQGLASYCTYENGEKSGRIGAVLYQACESHSEFSEGWLVGAKEFIAKREEQQLKKITRNKTATYGQDML